MRSADDPKNYVRTPISNREGFRRIDASKEKLELADRATKEKICQVCQRRCRAWRIVPSVEGQALTESKTSFRGKFVLACDGKRDSCAGRLERAGVPQQAIAQQRAMADLGIIIPQAPSFVLRGPSREDVRLFAEAQMEAARARRS